MKSVFVTLGVVLMVSFALAAGGISGSVEAGNGEVVVTAQGNSQDMGVMNEAGEMERVRLQTGEHVLGDGMRLMVQQGSDGQVRLESGGSMARSSVSIDQEIVGGQTMLMAQLSNGRNAEVKVMPDTASEKALERLKIKNCSGECSIELKEVGAGEQAKLAYEVKTQRRAKVFGLFGAEMNVRAQVSAENGEVLQVNKPWWAFLASEPEE